MKINKKIKVPAATYFAVAMLSFVSFYFLYSSVVYQYYSGILGGILIGACALWFLPQTEDLINKFVKTTVGPVVKFLFSIAAVFLLVSVFIILFLIVGIWIASLSTTGIIILLLFLIWIK